MQKSNKKRQKEVLTRIAGALQVEKEEK